MSSPCRGNNGICLLLACLLVLAGCEREERQTRAEPVNETGPAAVSMTGLYPGEPSPPDPRGQEYEGNAFHLAQGKQLYTWFNCAGCHAHGGGDIGPALIDDQWIYGSGIENIYATIVQGRPNGMPSFRNKIPEQQVWQIAAYVRSMSGQASKAASPSRSDEMQNKPAEQSMPQEEPKDSSGSVPNLDGRQ